MKERPILFSAPMVRALLAGTKTQTRRALKPQPSEFVGGPGVTLRDGSPAPLIALDDSVEPYGREIACPYGQPGDRLWVRETFGFSGSGYIPDIHFRATNPEAPILGRWHPSIHMRRIDSRITLEITSVRVERLQDISEADAQAEGATPIPDPCDHVRLACADIGCSGPQPHRVGFRALWQDINGPGSWDANPWVWAIEFRRVP